MKFLIFFLYESLVVGTVAFDAIETPFRETDKIAGGAKLHSFSIFLLYQRNKFSIGCWG